MWCFTAAQGSAFYLAGCLLVVIGWTVIGLVVELYGFYLLFCEFLPTALQFFKRMPIMGKILELPFIKMVRCAALRRTVVHACARDARAPCAEARDDARALHVTQVVSRLAPMGGLPTTNTKGH